MERIINFIDIPRNIIKFQKRKTIEMYTGEKQKKTERNILIIWSFLLIALVLNLVLKNQKILIGTGVAGLLLLIIMKISGSNKKWSFGSKEIQLSKIILKDEEGKTLNLWELSNKQSLLIGKKTQNNEVDIDLSSSTYASLVSREHGILNFAGDKWYYEDIGSSNGSGIKRKSEEKKFKVEEGKTYRVYSGDILYIANTQLIIK